MPAESDDRRAPVLTFLGATGTVTGSRFLVDTATARVLVDCGLYQGEKELRLRNREPFPIDPRSIDAVVLTHAHVDHCGYLPALASHGFAGSVVSTHNTAALAGIVLPDSGHLQEEEASYANRKGFSKHHPALPLYTEEDARRSLELFSPIDFHDRTEIAEGITIELRPGGHILGSSIVHLDVLAARGPRRITFSGDLGRPDHPLLVPPEPIGETDVLLVESTYGDRVHDDASALDMFAAAINRTVKRGGVIVIPAFAVDRTEVLLIHLAALREAGSIPDLPVYVDSPMALATLDVYRRAIDQRSAEIRPTMLGTDPFAADQIEEVHEPQDSMRLDELRTPAIIISASGMATGGRVLHHLRRYLPDHRSTIILVGFQARATRGRLLADGAKVVKLLGRYIKIKAEVVDLPSFSVHADRAELLSWLRTADAPPEATYIVHGEPDSSEALRQAIDDELQWPAVVPHYGERVRLD